MLGTKQPQGKVCPQCKSVVQVSLDRCVCGHQFSTAFATPGNPNPTVLWTPPKKESTVALWLTGFFAIVALSGFGYYLWWKNTGQFLPGPQDNPPAVNGMGCAEIAVSDLKKWVNDPASLQIIECEKMTEYDKKQWAQVISLRSKNGFGALVVGHRRYYMTHDTILLSQDASE
jgi:hypothetical protein